MKKLHLKVLLLVGVLCGLTTVACAHPPSDVLMKFDQKSKLLTITTPHTVMNAQRHFIDEIDVKVNGKTVVTQSFSSQKDAKEQAVRYILIDAKPGDTITVRAVCNMGGELSKDLVMSKAK